MKIQNLLKAINMNNYKTITLLLKITPLLLIKNYAILVLRHLRVVGGNTRVELGLGTGMRDNTRVGLITGRAAWVPFGIAAWGPRIACRDLCYISTHGTWIWRAAWKPRGNGTRVTRFELYFHAWRVDLARRVYAAWKWRVFLARRVDAAWK